jgi:hypothetical protein
MRNALLTSGLLLVSFGSCAQQDTLPEVNQRIVAFVREHIGERVGRGECWDLAAEALNAAGARWDGDYGFGREVDPDREPVLPGDIVQFEGVEFRWEEGRDVHSVRMPHHTAVVLEVRAPGAFVAAQQNTQETGRKTGTGDLVLSRRIKGKISFFRPVG